ncbi:MAG: endolytic transglycosylase MltG [Rhodospirillales bacterium]|nr:endolytic transglycosylase MltG [Rhodospirillales bacterium]
MIIPKGAGIDRIAGLLAERGLISNVWVFRLGAMAQGATTSLRAGEFLIPADVSSDDVLKILRSGKTVVRRLTVAEGLTTAEVLERLSRKEGLTGRIASRPGEGRLLPETYYFSYGDPREGLVQRMRVAMKTTLGELWSKRKAGVPYKTPTEALVMASIVERETGLAEERGKVAGVFVNRLNRGMRLQSDPTVIYGLVGASGYLGRRLTRKDLADDHPYNTYIHSGLPPGPIANPGRAALEAALNPAETDALYFVADGTGGHAFARTLKEHNRNVAAWREIQRRKKTP